MNTTPMQSSTMRKKSGKLVMPTLIKNGENTPTNVENGTIKMKLPMIRFKSILFNNDQDAKDEQHHAERNRRHIRDVDRCSRP